MNQRLGAGFSREKADPPRATTGPVLVAEPIRARRDRDCRVQADQRLERLRGRSDQGELVRYQNAGDDFFTLPYAAAKLFRAVRPASFSAAAENGDRVSDFAGRLDDITGRLPARGPPLTPDAGFDFVGIVRSVQTTRSGRRLHNHTTVATPSNSTEGVRDH